MPVQAVNCRLPDSDLYPIISPEMMFDKQLIGVMMGNNLVQYISQ